MGRIKRDLPKTGVAIAGTLLLLGISVWLMVFVVLVPASADAYSGTAGHTIAGTMQLTPTIDLTVTALAKEQLTLQVQQLQHQLQNQNNWFANNSTALIAAAATVIVALFGISQWFINRRDERRKEVAAQDKDLRAQAEERFKAAVTALGSENEATQIGGAILLRSFLNRGDREIYARYYTQIFDLAVAYLRLPRSSHPLEDSNAPLPLTTLSQVLIIVFKESFPLARDRLLQEQDTQFRPQSLDASDIQLDSAYLRGADLRQAWMRRALLRKVKLRESMLMGADLREASLREATIPEADLSKAILVGADLSGTKITGTRLTEALLMEADLTGADLTGADLQSANLEGANLEGVNIEAALSLKNTNLRSVKGLSREQFAACKAKGAIVDENITASPPQSSVQSNGAQTPLAPSAQVTISPGSSSASAQPQTDP